MGWNNSGNQWGPTGGNPSNGSGGWGPPPAKPGQGGGAGGGWGNSGPAPGPAPGPRAPQWGGAGGGVDNDSPTMARRFDDGGTSIWGGKSQSAMPGGPPGGQYFRSLNHDVCLHIYKLCDLMSAMRDILTQYP